MPASILIMNLIHDPRQRSGFPTPRMAAVKAHRGSADVMSSASSGGSSGSAAARRYTVSRGSCSPGNRSSRNRDNGYCREPKKCGHLLQDS